MRISDWSSDVCSSDLVEFRIVRIDRAFGQRDGLAPEPSDLFQHRDAACDLTRGDAAHLVGRWAFLQQLFDLAIERPARPGRLDARLHIGIADRTSTRLTSSH